MKSLAVVIPFFLILTACAGPMPGDVLYPGIKQPANLDEIEITETVDFFATIKFCNESLAKQDPLSFAALMFLSMGIPPLGCAKTYWDKETGIISHCEVYLLFDVEEWRAHEYRHCEGYMDVLAEPVPQAVLENDYWAESEEGR